MARVFYVHWNREEALAAVRELRAAGHSVRYHADTGAEAWQLLKDPPPDIRPQASLADCVNSIVDIVFDPSWTLRWRPNKKLDRWLYSGTPFPNGRMDRMTIWWPREAATSRAYVGKRLASSRPAHWEVRSRA